MNVHYIHTSFKNTSTSHVGFFKISPNLSILLGLLKFSFKEKCTNFTRNALSFKCFRAMLVIFFSKKFRKVGRGSRESSYFGQTFF